MKLLFLFLKTSLNFLCVIFPGSVGKFGFKQFCTPRSKPLNKFQLDFLQTGKNERLRVQGKEVQTYKWGYGATNILLVHGWASNTFRWKAYIENFDKSKYTLHAVDAFAHGLSGGDILYLPIYSDLIHSIVQHIGRVDYIIGHSIGGFATTLYLHQQEESTVKKAVIMASPGKVEDFFLYAKNTLGFSERLINEIKSNFKKIVGKEVEYYVAKNFARSINVPCLIIHDEEDKETLIENSVMLHKSWKNSEFLKTSGYGHNLKGEEVYKLIENYLE